MIVNSSFSPFSQVIIPNVMLDVFAVDFIFKWNCFFFFSLNNN